MKKVFFVFALLVLTITIEAQQLQYRVSFPNAIHHEARIELTASHIPTGPAVFRMSRSSPGRYAAHEFGKNVYDVTAVDPNGKPLVLKRTDGDVYEVSKHKGNITIAYTLYANHADGTYAGIDPESIHLNMPACFMWLKGMENIPVEIRFEVPKENKGIVATQLNPTAKPYTYTAPGLQYFMDSPTKIGDLITREWPVTNADGKKINVRIALEAVARAEQVDELVEKTKKIVAEARAVFGEFPLYETGNYTFIASANPYVQGDGMEHRNSTMISVPISSFDANELLGVFSHEFFHGWNVERIRPRTLEPFHFEKSNMSHELWFAEGFTQYYGELLLARAGLTEQGNYLSTIARLVNSKQQTPGAKYYSPVQASNHAVYVDAAVSIDRNNYPNMFTSYYFYGASLALALDIELQGRYNKSIDAYMQAMWKRFGKSEIPYTISLMQETLAGITDASFAADFFDRYINGHDAIDYAALLAKAGYEVKNSNEGKAVLGINTRVTEQGKLIIASNTVKGSAAYEAGLDINDEILRLDDTAAKTTSDINRFLQQKKPGDVVVITYKHRGNEKQAKLTLKEQVFTILVPFEQSGRTVTSEMKKIRNSWFSSRVP